MKQENLSNSSLYSHEFTIYYTFMKLRRSYLPTPPLGQDMTHGQFLSGV